MAPWSKAWKLKRAAWYLLTRWLAKNCHPHRLSYAAASALAIHLILMLMKMNCLIQNLNLKWQCHYRRHHPQSNWSIWTHLFYHHQHRVKYYRSRRPHSWIAPTLTIILCRRETWHPRLCAVNRRTPHLYSTVLEACTHQHQRERTGEQIGHIYKIIKLKYIWPYCK